MTAPTRRDHLLPPNATPLEKALSAQNTRIFGLPVWLIRAVWDPDTCPVPLLPYLAQAWSVDEWDPAWSEEQKRQAIKDSVELHRRKGTLGALRRAIAQLGYGATVSRWIEQTPRGAPYTFKLFVHLDQVTAWTTAEAKTLIRVAVNNKAARSFLDAVVLKSTPPPAPVYVGGVSVARVVTRYLVSPVTSISLPRGTVYVGAATCSRVTSRILPLPN